MRRTITLKPHFLTVASYWHELQNPYRNRVEVGGFLVANPATPDTIAFATGPGKGATHAYAEIGMFRHEVQPAVEAAGYSVVGDWHSHPLDIRPSDTDKQTWLSNLKNSTLEKWHSIILVRGDNQWRDMGAWSTYWRDGHYRLGEVDVTPGLSAARELERDQSWMVKQSSLVDQAAWIKDPHRLHLDLAVLDSNADLLRRMRMKETNERLKRLGFKEISLSPLPRREVEVPGEVIYGDGSVIRRYFTPPSIVVR